MATITKFLKGAANKPMQHIGGHLMSAENVLNFGADGFKDVTSSDIVQCLILPINAVVTKVTLEVTTAEGTAATGNVGDTDDVDGYAAAFDLNVAGALTVGAGAYAANGVRYNSAGRTIDIIPSADLDTCELWIQAEYYIRELF
jgi:phage baseplate assembly protein gpV